MNNGLYAACAGLLARSQALEVAANNLANVNTGGYRAQTSTFRTLLANPSIHTSSLTRFVNQFGVLGESRIEQQQGPIDRTGNDLDLAIQGQGYFALQTPEGVRYTRNGAFHVDSQGRLAAADGSLVMGLQGPILLPAGKLSVSSNGTISVNGALAGEVRLVEFAPGTQLTPEGSSNLTAPVGSERPVTEINVVQGALEASNVNAVGAAVGLVSLQRNAEMLQRALTCFHSDFNRIAAQELSRI